ncbi:MAG: phage tail sheath family protein [Streptosporangiaceae bacterium]
MPITPTYPGVYIEEVQSSVHTIVGVPTSVAAFVGYAARGLVDTAVQVSSWADYQRAFGGLDPASPMSYAAFLFFMNGGNSAQIVRASATDGSGAAAKIALSGDVILVATSPGTWGNAVYSAAVPPSLTAGLQVVVDTSNLVNAATLFNLTITDGSTGAIESYTGLSLGAGPPGTPGTPITTALASSALMNVEPGSGLTQKPANGTYTVGTFTPPPAPASSTSSSSPTSSTSSAGDTASSGSTPSAGASTPAPAAPAGGSQGTDINAGSIAVVPADQTTRAGIYALVEADIFNMLCLPTNPGKPWPAATLGLAAEFCFQQRAMLIVDPPSQWTQAPPPLGFTIVVANPAVTGNYNANAATYYPNLEFADPITNTTVQLGPCGAVAGVWASTDDARGVWKAPAGTAAALTGISDLSVHVDDSESAVLNPIAVNCLRTLPLVGPVSWGARTAAGADELASQWKYIPVRRTALFIEESLRRGTQWAVFEPNDEPLWSSIRLNIGAFMNSLFKQGAFQGSTPAEAYLVQCDADNNPQSSIDLGILNILVGFQPLMPAEFVIIQIEQLVGQLQG